jgi:hypothetical protein
LAFSKIAARSGAMLAGAIAVWMGPLGKGLAAVQILVFRFERPARWIETWQTRRYRPLTKGALGITLTGPVRCPSPAQAAC